MGFPRYNRCMGNEQSSATTQAAGYSAEERRGILAGVFCYALWGILPIYWKLLAEVNPFEITAHRIIWCFATTLVVCLVARLGLPALLRQKRAWKFLLPAGVLIASNWAIYIYAVNNGHVVEASIGYYINPLVSVLLGVVLFRERLSVLQGLAVVFCTVGVVYFTLSYGQFPWIALALAFTFGIYGALKKQAAYSAVTALAFENTVMLVPAIVFAVMLAQVTGTHAFGVALDTGHGRYLTALLVIGGPLTALPLILFAKAANSIPLSLLGFIQYVSPTLTLITGVFLFGEPFTMAHAVCFGCIWCGLALVSFDAFVRNRR